MFLIFFSCTDTTNLSSSSVASSETIPDEDPPEEEPTTCGGRSYCKIFLSTAAPNGDLGGITGADSICANDVLKPEDGSTYKALLVDGDNRKACVSENCIDNGISEQIDWVLYANREYRRTDGSTVIGTTNSLKLFELPLTAAISPLGNGDTADVFTGLDTSWRLHVDNCVSWTSSNANFFGKTGGYVQVTMSSFSISVTACNKSGTLYCVEQ